MAELLLELLSEEIPARMQARAAEDLKRLVTDGLKKAGLDYDQAEAYVTPRRLALVVDGLPLRQPDTTVEKKGPRVGAPEEAIQGFLKANALTSIEEAETRETDRGEFYFAIIEKKGKPTKEIVGFQIFMAISALSWTKSMRWGTNKFPWVRPIQNFLLIFDGQPVEGVIRMGRGDPAPTIGGYSSSEGSIQKDRMAEDYENYFSYSNSTRAHRFLAPEEFEVTSFADYRDRLRAAKVILDPEERKAIIAEQAARLAAAEGLTIKVDPDLLAEVAGMVEWPVVFMGSIDESLMDLPPEVLSTVLRHHQKYFSTLDKDGNLADRFVMVADMPARKGSKRYRNIVAGNERVLRARLADARFFWDQDRKRTLASRAPDLGQMVFHAKLGSLDDKADRMQALAAALADRVPGADKDRVRSAARLAKADLTTGMVGEFPELQGVMGRYYALADGEDSGVADAIALHYLPQAGTGCPTTDVAPIAVVIGLADRIDTLVGFWAVGETPTGSKDPYALRRAALGVIRLILENKLRLPLAEVIAFAHGLYRDLGGGPVVEPLLDFFADRLKVALKDSGMRHDLISAVFALGGEDDLLRLVARVEALKAFLGSEDGEHLLVAYRRAANIVRIEQRKDRRTYNGEGVNAELLREADEKAVAETLSKVTERSNAALADERFGEAMAALATLRQPVDSFFDNVTVNCDEPALRENRLQLLSRIQWTMDHIADFSKIEG